MTHHKHDDPQESCPNCDIGPFIKNNYFRGKFMDVFDFTAEQRYFIDKLRHHHQRLHGWGVVCGLKVKPHANSNCRDRFICIEPGSALDCCGHDILVLEEECIDFTQLPAVKALVDKKDTGPRRLQICLRYRECPTEPVPVLYDECGCDENRCAPNRILESFEFDAILGAEDEATYLYAPKFQWDFTLNLAHAYRAVLHDATDPPRLYVLTEDNSGIVYQIDTVNHSTLTAYNLLAKGIALAVSNDGTRVYAVAEPADSTKDRQLYVLDTTQPGLPTIHANPIDIPRSVSSDVVLAVAQDGRLLALLTGSGELLRWATDIDSNSPPPADPVSIITLGAGLNTLAIGSDGKYAYAAGNSNAIQQIDIEAKTSTAIPLTLPSTDISCLAIVKNAGKDILIAADQAGNQVYLWQTSSGALTSEIKVPIPHPPVALVASPDARWLYVLEREAGASHLQVINIQAWMQGQQIPPGAAFEIGHPARALALAKSGARLYVPYTGDLQVDAVGGVAVVEISEQNCCDIPWRQLEGCPDCDTPNCIVLATIENFQVGDSIQDQTDPPADPETDKKAHIARIDNRKDRRLLPTPQVLLELIECLKQGPSGKAAQGPPGQPGLKGDKGSPGPGFEPVTGIEALSWKHNVDNSSSNFLVEIKGGSDNIGSGIVIGFTAAVDLSKIDQNPEFQDPVFQVLVEQPNEQQFICRCAIRGSIVPVDLTLDVNDRIVLTNGCINSAQIAVTPSSARGLAFIPGRGKTTEKTTDIVFNPERGIPSIRQILSVWIILRGDFILDTNKPPRAIDAEFVRAELPTGNRLGTNPPLGIQGGTFESWFTINDANGG